MSFTDGKPWTATEEDCRRSWDGGKGGKNFRCAFCGHKFVPGDIVRWQYTNNVQGASGNPLVCESCDREDIVEIWKAMCSEYRAFRKRMWWFSGRIEN